MGKEVAAVVAVLVHGHGGPGEVVLYLEGLVAKGEGRSVHVHDPEAAALALVAARQHRQVAAPPLFRAHQGVEDHFRMRGLSRTSHRNVAYTDGWNLSLPGFYQEVVVIHCVTDLEG